MIAIKGMEMPKYCLEVTTRPFYSDEVVYNHCPFYNICAYRETIEANVKPADCPLVEIITCKDCKYNNENTCDLNGYGINDDYFCASGERKVN